MRTGSFLLFGLVAHIFAVPMVMATGDDEYKVFLKKFDFEFESKPDGSNMTAKEREEAINDLIQDINDESDGFQILGSLDVPTTTAPNTRRLPQIGYNRDFSKFYYGTCNSCYVCVSNCPCKTYYQSKNSHRNLAHALPFRSVNITDPSPNTVDDAIVAHSNAKIAMDTAKELLQMAKKERKSAAEAFSAARKDWKAAKEMIVNDDTKTDSDKTTTNAHRIKVRELATIMRKAKMERTKANDAVKTRFEDLTKARDVLARAKEILAKFDLATKSINAMKKAIVQADKQNHKLHMTKK